MRILRSIAAVVGGYAGTGLLVVLTDALFSIAIPGLKAMERPPDYYFGISVFTATLYSMAGGWACAAIASDHRREHVLALIAFGELMGVAATVALWNKAPHWYSFALLILYPPAVWIGSRVRSAKRLSAAA